MDKLVSIHNVIGVIKEKLDHDGEVLITVTGGSMRPFLIDRSTQVTLAKPKSKLKKYDIVLYKSPAGAWVLHRIIKLKDDDLIICGDALKTNEYINKNEVIGVVTRIQTKDKVTFPNQLLYRIGVRLWVFLKPFRRYLLFLFRRKK